MSNKIVVITVTLNDEEGLKKTIKSLDPMSDIIYSHIIIDGGSKNIYSHKIKEYRSKSAYPVDYLSELDDGIFDAMNKGINIAKSKYHIDDLYLLFLNSGDEFYCTNKSLFIDTLAVGGDLILYNALVINSNSFYIRPIKRSPEFYRFETPVHQATLFIGRIFNSCMYSPHFPHQADTELIYKLINNGVIINYYNFEICKFYYGGTSSSYESKKKCMGILSEQIYIMTRYNSRGFIFVIKQVLFMIAKYYIVKYFGSKVFSIIHFNIIKNK